MATRSCSTGALRNAVCSRRFRRHSRQRVLFCTQTKVQTANQGGPRNRPRVFQTEVFLAPSGSMRSGQSARRQFRRQSGSSSQNALHSGSSHWGASGGEWASLSVPMWSGMSWPCSMESRLRLSNGPQVNIICQRMNQNWSVCRVSSLRERGKRYSAADCVVQAIRVLPSYQTRPRDPTAPPTTNGRNSLVLLRRSQKFFILGVTWRTVSCAIPRTDTT